MEIISVGMLNCQIVGFYFCLEKLKEKCNQIAIVSHGYTKVWKSLDPVIVLRLLVQSRILCFWMSSEEWAYFRFILITVPLIFQQLLQCGFNVEIVVWLSVCAYFSWKSIFNLRVSSYHINHISNDLNPNRKELCLLFFASHRWKQSPVRANVLAQIDPIQNFLTY